MLPAFLDSIIARVYEGVLCNSCRMHWHKKQGAGGGAVAHSFPLCHWTKNEISYNIIIHAGNLQDRAKSPTHFLHSYDI